MRPARLFLKVVCALSYTMTTAHEPVPGTMLKDAGTVTFTENKGQVSDQFHKPRPDVRFYGEQGPMSFHITDKGISYQLRQVASWTQREGEQGETEVDLADSVPAQIQFHRIDITWPGCDPHAPWITSDRKPGHTNYYLEVCPDGVTHVATYGDVVRKDIYPGIDLRFYSKDGRLKYDYIVSPHADISAIRLDVAGAEIGVLREGSVQFNTPLGEVIDEAPAVFQDGEQLPASWSLDGNTLSFSVEGREIGKPMVIDPGVRTGGTYYGGTDEDRIMAIKGIQNGSTFIAGFTFSTSGIATSGTHDATYNAYEDGFVARMNGTSTRVWGTYFGGSLPDYVLDCALIGSNDIAVCGGTQSTTGIHSFFAHQGNHGGGIEDAFLCCFDHDEGLKTYGTYYGGTGVDHASSCGVDADDNLYMCGRTSSEEAISTAEAYMTSLPSVGSGFLVKFSTFGTRTWATYYPGRPVSLAIDPSSTALYMTGTTTSGTDIATPGAYMDSPPANNSGFITGFSSDGQNLFGTYWWVENPELFYGIPYTMITCDTHSHILFAGSLQTDLDEVTTTNGSASNGGDDVLVAKFSANGGIIWSRFWGGSSDEFLFGAAVDPNDHLYLTGATYSENGIATPGAHQQEIIPDGWYGDAYMTRLDTAGNVDWGTYYGGDNREFLRCIHVDDGGRVHAAGFTDSATGIATTGSFQPTRPGTGQVLEGFYTTFCIPVEIGSVVLDGPDHCDDLGTATVSAIGGSSALEYTWLGEATNSTSTTALFDPGAIGSVIVTSPTGFCASADTMAVIVPVPPGLEYSVEVINALCSDDSTGSVDITITQGTAPYFFDWSNGSDDEDLTGVPVGTYTLYVSDDHNCTAETEFIIAAPEALQPTITDINEPLCAEMATGSIDLEVTGGTEPYSYEWSTGFLQQDPHSLVADIYSVIITDAHDCEASIEATIEEPEALTIVADVTDEAFGNDGAIDITVSGGTPGYTYDWTNDSTSADLTGLEGGLYTVYVTDQNGCKDSLQIEVGSTVGIAATAPGTNWSVVFDPTLQVIIVTGAEHQERLDVLDVAGRAVDSRITRGATTLILVPHLVPGVYVVRSSAGSAVNTRKLLVYR